MSTAGSLRTTLSWQEISYRLRDNFRKWGIREYVLPQLNSSQTGVTVDFLQAGEWRQASCSRFPRPHENYHALLLAFEAVRKADQRGIAGVFAQVAQAFALPEPATGPYAVLGVRPGDAPERIRDAYMDRIKETHPDHGGDPREFQRVREAGRELGITG